MSDATYIELPPEQKKRPFFRTFRGWAICLFIAAVLAGAGLSWWLTEGRIASVYARVDANVYTVEAVYATTIEGILTRVGDMVAQGQALARIDPTTFPAAKTKVPLPGRSVLGEIHDRLEATEATEKQMMVRIAQARAEEERFQKVQQDTVTDHVRAQLIMRSMDRNNPYWEQASQTEAAARHRMDRARENFERVSKLRAALDTELARIRIELWRKKQKAAQKPADPPPPPPKPEPEHIIPNMLYAPVAGQILSIDAQAGGSVQPGQTVFTIMPTETGSPRWIQAFFPADAQERLKQGQNVQVRTAGGHYMGKIAEISSQLQTLPQTGNTPYLVVRVNLEDSRVMDKLQPGAGVECQVQTRYILGEQMSLNLF